MLLFFFFSIGINIYIKLVCYQCFYVDFLFLSVHHKNHKNLGQTNSPTKTSNVQSSLCIHWFPHVQTITTLDSNPLKILGLGRLLAPFLCRLLLSSLRPLMFECVSPLIVSVSLVNMLFLVFLSVQTVFVVMLLLYKLFA